MDQRLKDVVDHREMVVMVLELTLEIDQIGCQTVQPLGKELLELVGDFLLRLEESIAAVDHVGTARRGGTHRRHVRNVEQNGNFAEDSAGIRDDVDLEVPLQDLDLAVDQDVEEPGCLAFGEKHGTGLELPHWKGMAKV
jgi:hypothetical protein